MENHTLEGVLSRVLSVKGVMTLPG